MNTCRTCTPSRWSASCSSGSKADGKRIALASSAKPDELERYAADRRDQRPDRAFDLLGRRREVQASPRYFSRPRWPSWAISTQSKAIVVGDSPWDAIAAIQGRDQDHRPALRRISPRIDLKAAGCVAIFIRAPPNYCSMI